MPRVTKTRILKLVVAILITGVAIFLFALCRYPVEVLQGTFAEIRIEDEVRLVFSEHGWPPPANARIVGTPKHLPPLTAGPLVRPVTEESESSYRVFASPSAPAALGPVLLVQVYRPAGTPFLEDPGSPPEVELYEVPGAEQRIAVARASAPRPGYLLYPDGDGREFLTLIEILWRPNGKSYLAAEGKASLERLGPWAPIAYLAIYTIGCVFFFPNTILLIVGALAFGPWLGTLYVNLGANLGAAAAFGVGRWVARDTADGLMPEWARRLSQRLDSGGFKTIFALRLVPFCPYNALNYAAGLSRMRFRDYMLGGALGMTPVLFLWVQGTALASRLRFGDPLLWLPVALLVLLFVVPYGVKRRKKAPEAG